MLNNKSKLPSLLYNTFSHFPVTPDTVMMQYHSSTSAYCLLFFDCQHFLSSLSSTFELFRPRRFNPCSEGSCTFSKCFCYGVKTSPKGTRDLIHPPDRKLMQFVTYSFTFTFIFFYSLCAWQRLALGHFSQLCCARHGQSIQRLTLKLLQSSHPLLVMKI